MNTTSDNGDIRGVFRATITWDNTALGVTKFMSSCISGAWGDKDTFDEGDGRFEAKYIGVIWNYPETNPGGQAGMAEIHWSNVGGNVTFDTEFELGTDYCDTGVEIDLSAAEGGSASAHGHGGRSGSPDEFCP